MEHLNLCRQMVRQFKAVISAAHPTPTVQAVRSKLKGYEELLERAEKFLMPYGGLAVDDLEFRGIDSTGKISLPYKSIVIEYVADCCTELKEGQVSAPKRIIYAVQFDDYIAIKLFLCKAKTGEWAWLPTVMIGRTDTVKERRDGRCRLLIEELEFIKDRSTVQIILNDYGEEVTVLMSLLSALSCSNVKVEQSRPKNSHKKIKSALPFDTYNILTIDSPNRGETDSGQRSGSHRSPREHLRRGHIRRLSDGRRIWVNAAVICAGAAGKITKDYRIASREAL